MKAIIASKYYLLVLRHYVLKISQLDIYFANNMIGIMDRQADRRMAKETFERTDYSTDGQTDRQDTQAEGRMVKQTDKYEKTKVLFYVITILGSNIHIRFYETFSTSSPN